MLRDGLRCHGVSAETIFGDTPNSERDSIVARFKRREIRALVSMGVLTTGFNAKHVDLIALARPTKSTGLYVQMLGRGTRLCEGKTDCRVLDFGGNIARHGPFDAPVVKDDKKRGRGPEKPEPRDLYKPCVNLACEAMSPTSARECAECGAQFPDVERFVDTEAADLPVMSAPADRSVQWVGVTSVRYSRWEKPGKLPTLRVIYNAGLLEYSEWIALQSKRGERWMRERFPSGAGAMTIDSAIELSARFLCPAEIAIRPNGKYHDVVGYKFKTAEIIPIRKNAA